jgi:hypothetical protein
MESQDRPHPRDLAGRADQVAGHLAEARAEADALAGAGEGAALRADLKGLMHCGAHSA